MLKVHILNSQTTQTNGVPDVHTEEKPKTAKAGLGIRHVQCVLLFFALLVSYAMRVNMSMAIVAMTDSSNEDAFDWSMRIQSVILSSFSWGYVVMQVPGGLLAHKVGGSILITIAIGFNSLVTLVVPTAANYGGWQAVCFCRVLQGLTQGVLYPSTHNLIGKWVPSEERGRLGTLIYAGAQTGTAVEMITAGFIAEYLGWEAIFYVVGVVGIIWTVVYVFIGASSPQQSKIITEKEKQFIQKSLSQVEGESVSAIPWKAFFTSIPFISLIVVHCGQMWGLWTLMNLIPSYMSSVLGVDITRNGVMSALPYLAMVTLSFPFAFLSDFVLTKNWISTTATRKISNSIGHVGPALFLMGLAYVPAGNISLAVGLLCIVVGLNAGHYTGFMLVHLDMSPNFAGTMIGITNGVANFFAIFAPLAAGAIIDDETDANEWQNVFYLSSVIYIVGNIIFMVFGTSKRQSSWNESAQMQATESRIESPTENTEKST